MILKDILKTMEYCKVRIFIDDPFIDDHEPAFEGLHDDVPWTLVDLKVREFDGICPFVNGEDCWLRITCVEGVRND